MLKAEAVSRGAVLPININTTTFPGGEVHVAIEDRFADHTPHLVRITAHLRSPADQMALFMLTDAIRRAYRVPIHLDMPYVPYARQDRGYIRVEEVGGEFVQFDRQTRDQMEGGALKVVFRDGHLKNRDTFSAIRKRLGAL